MRFSALFLRLSALALVSAVIPVSTSKAASVSVTPATLVAVLKSAKGGETIVLQTGDYGKVIFPYRDYPTRVVVDATAARFSQIWIRRVSGLEIRGGSIVGARTEPFTMAIDSSRNLRVANMTMSGARVGISLTRSQGIDIISNRFDGLRSDGVNIAMTSQVLIQGNSCRNFNPIQAVYSSTGALIKDGDHPDCIQGWSSRGYTPISDISIVGNTAVGYMQGIFFGNTGQGGYDRITIRDNDLTVGAFNGIILWEARSSTVTRNKVKTVPGARLKSYPFALVSSWIQLTGRNIVACGNTAASTRYSVGLNACPQQAKAF